MRIKTLLLAIFIIHEYAYAQLSSIPPERWKLVDDYLNQQKDFSGIVMIGTQGEIKFNQGYGFADRERKVAYSDQTLYTIGSITKSFTATAIMLLMEQGKINPSDPITDFFAEVPDDKKGITIHHLLTHSSGLPGAIGDDYEAITAEEFQKRAWAHPLSFKPGDGYEYSNVGYSLLGMIVEKLSGKKYDLFLQKNIFAKAGMETAGYTNATADYTKMAHGYLSDGSDSGTSKDKLWNDTEPFWNLKANGGLLMSAKDLYHWYLALRENKILKPETLKKQITPYVDEGEGSYYGYGFAVSPDGEVVQHNGGNRIFKADFRWFPKSDMFFFSATNDANVKLFRINDEILRILTTGEVPVQENWTEVSKEFFPSNALEETAEKFIELIKNYSIESADKFIDEYCTQSMIERNGREKLKSVFERLSGDGGQHEFSAIMRSEGKIKLVYPAREESEMLKIVLTFTDNKLERLSAEIERI